MIDITFDFRSDSKGKDPDAYSPTLNAYHRRLFHQIETYRLFIVYQFQRISLSSSMISASVFSSTKREMSSIRLSAIALCGTIAATPITII